MAFIISAMNHRNGAGKTTAVINLGCALSLSGAKALLVDFDPQAGLTLSLGLEKAARNPARAVYGKNGAVSDAIKRVSDSSLYILPAGPELGAIEVEHRESPNRNGILVETLGAIEGDYDFILVDSPSMLEFYIANAACASNAILIPVPCLPRADENLRDFLNILDTLRFSHNLVFSYIGVLFNFYSASSAMCSEIVREVKRLHSGLFFKTKVPRCRALAESAYAGRPAVEYDITAIGSMSYTRLALEVIDYAGKKAA